MANPDHLKWLLEEGTGAWNKRRRTQYLRPDLQQADLRGAILRKADLQEADLHDANLKGVDLQGANLQGAILQGADLLRADLRGADLQAAHLRGADLHEANLRGTDLQGANLQWAILREADLQEADLHDANLDEANLRGADLQDANLHGVILRGADLQEAHLPDANLRAAILQGANLRRTDLQGANLRGANLRGTDLRGADLLEAILLEANVQTIKSTLHSKTARRTDFRSAKNMTQVQVEAMNGDTGVLLPDGLKHPEHWPEWEDETEPGSEESKEPDLDGTNDGPALSGTAFVFLSYSSEDRENIFEIRQKLLQAGVPCWWDQDIRPGDDWRQAIGQQLETASVVLTFWSANSVQSAGVKEEASIAQKNRKLAHVRLDKSKLPYGYAETQYQDLVNWDGNTDDPRWKKVVSVLKDRLFPPSREKIVSRLGQTGPRSAIPVNGKIGVADTPPDGRPEVEDPPTLEQVFEEVDRICISLLKIWELEPPQTSRKIRITIEETAANAHSRDGNWFTWRRIIGQLDRQIANEDQDAWRGFDIEVESLKESILELRKFLERIPVKNEKSDTPELGPEIRFEEQSAEDVRQLSKEIENLIFDPNTVEVLTNQAINELVKDNQDLKEGLEKEENPNTETRQQRFSIWRFAVTGLAGFAATAITVITGTSVNLLTNPEAAKTLSANLQHILDLLMRFF